MLVEGSDGGTFLSANQAVLDYTGLTRLLVWFLLVRILAADFWQFLCDRKYAIDTAEQIREFVAEWLSGVKPSYFSRAWPLAGVKKDAPGTRKQWAYLWVQYRKDPEKLPPVKYFREPRP